VHPIFQKFPAAASGAFLGETIRPEFGVGPVGSMPGTDPEYWEWIDVLESVDQAEGSYMMMELGAGFGRWSVRAALAARYRGLAPIRVIAVEAEPTHFEWLHLHLSDNGFAGLSYELIQAAVSDSAGRVGFLTGRPAEWYGQCIAPEGQGVEVRKLSLRGLLEPLSRVDLIDLDVQGEELRCIASAIEQVDAKVKRLQIGTHSAEIEAGLRSLLTEHGWKCQVDFGLLQVNETPYGPMQFTDGVQSWVNPRLVRP
jgi:FkbM family methyltransferase